MGQYTRYKLVVDLDEGATEIGAQQMADEIKSDNPDVIDVQVQEVD